MYFHVAWLAVFIVVDMFYDRRFARAFNYFQRAGVIVGMAGLVTVMGQRVTG